MPDQIQISDPTRRPGDADAPIEEPIDVRRLLEALRRSRFLIAGIIAVLTCAVLAISLVLPENYRASAKVVVAPEGAGSSDAEAVRRHLFTMRALVMTPDVLRTSANRLAGETTESLEVKTQSSVDPDANIINVVATDTDATEVAQIANTVALTFVENRTEAERERLRRERADLLAELNRLRSSPEPGVRIRAIEDRLSALPVLEARAGSELQLAEFAEPPSEAWSPHPGRNAILAFLAAVLIAVLAALARHSLAPRVGSVGELIRLTALPVLNAVPTPGSPTRRNGGPSRNGLHRDLDDDGANDAYQLLSASIALQLPRDGQQMVLVAGPREDESKPAVVAALARALAQAGSHTLLVSADLRGPPLHRPLGVPQAPGLAELLAGVRGREDADPEPIMSAIREVPTQPGEGLLHVLPSGRIPPRPISLFADDSLDHVLGEINRLDYRYVLVDGPPLLQSGESQLLARRVDCALIVSRLDDLKVADALELRETLNRLGVRTLGFAVITGRRERRIAALTTWVRHIERAWASLGRAAASVPPVVRDRTARGAKAARARGSRPGGKGTERVSRESSETPSREGDPSDRPLPARQAGTTVSPDQRILELLVSVGRPVKEEELRAVLGYSRSTIQRHLERLVERTKVVRSGSGRRGDPYLYEPASRTDLGSARADERRTG